MGFLLQNPALSGLLALAALPLAVHLVARARPPRYRFSDLAFLDRVVRRTTRLRRPKDWLLLALRTAAIAALLAAFALPVIFSAGAALPGEKRVAIVIVDRSGSMAAREEAGIRYESAVAAAAEYLDKAKPDLADIVRIDAEPSAVFPEVGPNLSLLKDELRRGRPLPENAALKPAFDLALRRLASVKGHRELVIVSDFRASAWKDFAPGIPAGVNVLIRPVAKSSPANLAVVSLIAQPAEPVVGRPLSLLVRVRNYSTEPRRGTLTLDAGGALRSEPVEIPASGEVAKAFTIRVASAGPLPVTAALDADAFPDDDRRHLALEARETLRLAVVGDAASPSVRTLERFSAALPWIECVRETTPDASKPVDFLVAPDWDGADAGAFAKLTAAGVPVFVTPRAGVPPASLVEAGLVAPGAAFETTRETLPTGITAAAKSGAGIFTLFESGDYGDPLGGRFRERIRIPDAVVGSSKLVASYADGVPAILTRPAGRASATLLNLSLDPAKGEWPSRGEFLPAFAEMLLRSRPDTASEARETPSGVRLAWSPGEGRPGAVTLVDPDNVVTTPESVRGADGTVWRDPRRARPGLYRWRVSERTERFAAVNLPESVSDLRPLPEPPAYGRVAQTEGALVREAELGLGVPVWPLLLAAGMLFLLLESLVLGLTAPRSPGSEK